MFEFDHFLDIDVIVGNKLVVHEMLQFLFIDMSVPGGESDSGQTGVDKGVSSPSIDGQLFLKIVLLELSTSFSIILTHYLESKN